MSETVNLYQRSDIRFMASETARAATLDPKDLKNWCDRDILAGLHKDTRLNRWSFSATEVLQVRIMGELRQQAGMEPMHATGIARRIAETWHQYHAQEGNEAHLFCLIAFNDGTPIYSFRPLPEKMSAKLAEMMGDAEAREEIIACVHLRIPVYHLAKDVRIRLSNILRESRENDATVQ